MNALRSMAAALGGDVIKGRNGPFILCPGPGHSAKDRSLSVAPSFTAPDGFVVFSHAGDDWQACKDHVQERIGHARRENKRPSIDRSMGAVQLWNSAIDPGPIVERYLSSRGLKLPNDIAGRVVRFHPACPWGSAHVRAMLTAFRTISDDRLVAIHRTALADDGSKLDRRMLGPVKGAAIKIDRDEDVEQGLTIGEGFETCLAGRMLGFRPSWALGSADAIKSFPVLGGIECLTLLCETDDRGANARGVEICGRRWLAEGREVLTITPQLVGDLNDVVMP